MKHRPITFKPAILMIVALFIFCLYNVAKEKQPHTCKFKLCPYKGDLSFTHGCGSCEPGSDCYALDSLHFVYPDKDYDYIDSLLFTQVKK